MRHRTRLIAPALLAGTLLLAGCGGGGGSDAEDTTTVPSSGADTETTIADETLPTYDAPQQDFEELDGSQVRFVNVFAAEGEGTDVDVYWGYDADTGEKIATVPYGEVSDWIPAKTRPGGDSIDVVFYVAGETDRDHLLITQGETVDGDMDLTYSLGWTTPFDPSQTYAASLGVGFEHEAGQPADGKAWVAFNEIGIGGIEGGDFMVLSTATGCQDLTGIDIEGGTANAGQAIEFDPGTVELTASDANTDCSTRTDPVSLDLAAGDRVIVYAYGTTMEDRQLLAVPLGDA